MGTIRQAENPGELVFSHTFTGKVYLFFHPQFSVTFAVSSEAGERQPLLIVCSGSGLGPVAWDAVHVCAMRKKDLTKSLAVGYAKAV